MTTELRTEVEIALNGERRRFPAGTTVLGVIEALGLPLDRVAVEFDRVILKRPLWADTELWDGVQVEIVQFVGGG